MGISRFRKGNNGTVLIGCEAGRDFETLKKVIQNRLGSHGASPTETEGQNYEYKKKRIENG